MKIRLRAGLRLCPSILAMGFLGAGSIFCGAWAQVQQNATIAPAPISYAPGTRIAPASSLPLAADASRRAHTHLQIVIPPVGARPPLIGGVAPAGPPVLNSFYETPASIACNYNLLTVVAPGCNPNTATTNLATGSKAVAIVDAYDYANALSDLTAFSSQFGLPAPNATNFAVVYATGTKPTSGSGSGWDLEAALDIEYAHGLAPKAKIILVEAASNAYADLMQAVKVASAQVVAAGGGEVSMSFGGSEFASETSYDASMTTAKVVYFASSGDSAGTEYPCVSPNVVCVGGTSTSRNITTGKFQGEIAWSDTGGGSSVYEARPSYQAPIASIVGTTRGVPDIAAVADPWTGAWVYNTTYKAGSTWWIVGGTSLASPVMAAITNTAGAFRASSAAELAVIYSTVGAVGAGWNDVTSGACSYYRGQFAVLGWDFCTGVGSPRTASFKVFLATH